VSGTVRVETNGVPRKLKLLAAGLLLAALGILGYEADAAFEGRDPTISYVIRNHRLLKISVSLAAGIVSVAMAFLVAHFGFNVA
jgi:hypothetical protein